MKQKVIEIVQAADMVADKLKKVIRDNHGEFDSLGDIRIGNEDYEIHL